MMKTLLDLMNDELTYLKSEKLSSFEKLEDFINDDKLSATFIREMSKGIEFEMPDTGSSIYDIAQTRARHSAITFLMGLVFKNSFGLYSEIAKPFDTDKDLDLNIKDAHWIWLLTALNHDIAYTLKKIEDGNLSYKDECKYYLLQDNYADNGNISVLNDFSKRFNSFLAYTYSEIEAYDLYARKYHSTDERKEKDKEKIDHGIYGGIYVFDKKIRYCISNNLGKEEYIITKASALTIAQHNMYKSSKKVYDKDYGDELKKLHSSSDFKISRETPALLLLALVDTVECVKRLSKKENVDSYLETLTVLRNLKMEVNENEVIIDFDPLSKVIEKKNETAEDSLLGKLNDHIGRIIGMSKWSSFDVNEEGPHKIRIRLK